MEEKPDPGLQGRRAKAGAGPRMEGGTDDEAVLIGGNSFLERTKMPSWIKVSLYIACKVIPMLHNIFICWFARALLKNTTQSILHAYPPLHFPRQDREEVYAAIAARRAEEISSKTPVPITVTMPDGTALTAHKKTGEIFEAWKTSPYDVAASISQGLADASVVARVTYADYASDYNPAEDGVGGGDVLMGEGGDSDGEGDDVSDAASAIKPVLWDLTRPLVGNVARLELLKFESDTDAKTVFWHSSAHMLGEALEHLYGCRLTIGPPLAGGFYYDSYMGTGGDGTFKEDDYKVCVIVFLFVLEGTIYYLFIETGGFCFLMIGRFPHSLTLTITLFHPCSQSSKRSTRLSSRSKSSSVWS